MDDAVCFKLDTVLNIANIGLFRTERLWAHKERLLDHDVMIFVRKGFVHIIEEDKEYHIQPGQVFFMKHGLRHFGHLKTPEGSEWNWITFVPQEPFDENGLELGHYDQDHCMDPSLVITQAIIRLKLIEVDDIQRMCARMNVLWNHYINRTSHDWLKLNLGIMELLVDLHHQESQDHEDINMLVMEVKKYVSAHIYMDINGDGIKQALNMNYSYLSRVFTQETGMTIQKYIMHQKVKEAIRLFSEKNKNVSEVSDLLGYKSPYYFTRVFKKMTGYTPSSFKKKGYYDYLSGELPSQF
jgi:AraC family transcriptional regulator of arabinose operon